MPIRTDPVFTKMLKICLLISLVGLSSEAHSQNLDFYENGTKAVIPGFRDTFCPNLPRNEQSICETVRIRVDRSWPFQAFADKNGITISAGVAWIFDNIDWARTFSNEITGSDDCFNNYMAYVYDNIVRNTRLVGIGRAPVPVFSVVDYAPTETSCEEINRQTVVQVAQQAASVHAKGVESGLVFILLHELAHVVLGHTKLDPATLTMQQKRNLELDADTWAIKAANRSPYMIGSSMAPYFIGNIQGNTIDWEEHADHPLGVRRLANFYSLVVEDLETNPDRRLKLQENFDPVLDDMKTQRDRARKCLEAIEVGSTCNQ